jgi:putative hydrolase of the HAD superfamily
VSTRAVIFDFGGTLFSYEAVVGQRAGRARTFAGWVGHPADDMAPVVHAIREGYRRAGEEYFRRPFYLHHDMFAAAGRFAAEQLGYQLSDEHADAWARLAGAGLSGGVVPRPGMHATLQELRRRGIHVGAASNADCAQFEAMVDALEVRTLFDSLLCSEEAQSCKPDPRIFEIALERAGCAPAEALFVGDTPAQDIAGAEAVGMRPVLIEETSALAIDRGTPKPGQAIIRELPELLELL